MYKRNSFLGFVRIYIADQNALFNGLLLPPEVGGELVWDHEIPDPLQGRLHHLLGQPDDKQHILFFGKQEIHCWGQIRQKSAFWRTWVPSPTNQVCTTASAWITDLKPFR